MNICFPQFAIVFLLIATSVSHSQDTLNPSADRPEPSPLFQAGVDKADTHQYTNFREPVVVRMKSGRLIVGVQAGNRLGWPERSGQDLAVRLSDDNGKTWSPIVVAGPHHVRGKNDRAHQDALCRTSRDGGKTWSDITMIADAGMDSVLPTVLVYDERQDRVLFVYNVIFNDPDRPKTDKKPCQQFVMHSEDAGATWSEPKEILKDLASICVFGGGNGFQLRHGRRKGRLVIPGGTHSGGFSRGYYYSDNHGETWAFRKLTLKGRLEATGCELADDTIMLNHRQSGYGMAATFSRDGGETWSAQRPLLLDAWSACNNSALSVRDGKGREYLLIGAPLGPENAKKYLVEQDAGKLRRGVEDSRQVARRNGGIFISRDGGKTWPIGVCVTPGWTFGYNALVALPNGEIGLVFEGSPSGVDWTKAKRDHNTGARLGIYMVKFSLDWLLAQKTSPTSVATERTRPNILCIVVDDMGYSDVGCYGGEIDTPNIDKLADNGLRFSQFYNCGRCCPTRASLLTGLYPHKTGLGFMTARDYGKPGYRAQLNWNCVTLAEALKLGGYRTYMTGKWHVCKDFDPEGPKHNWPLQRGFDRFFGTLIAAGSQWNPMTLTEGNEPVEPQGDFFYTEAISRKAVEYIGSHDAADPFFLYVAHTAPHWPLHARASVIEKYRGRYAAGWDILRRSRLDRLVQAGILSKDLILSERSEGIPPWKEAPHKQWEQSRMEAYAAMVDHVDQGVGDIVQALRQKGLLENTLIFFLSDNGGDSLEHPYGRIGSTGKPWAYMRYVPLYTRDGRPVIAGDYPGLNPGPDHTYGGYGTKWANLSNTPFRYYKKYVHEGGVATPLIVHWPAGIKSRGELRHQPAHVIDLMATCLEIADVSYPSRYRNEPIKPMDGKSLLTVFTQDAAIHEALFFEHHGNRAVRKGKWKIVAIKEGTWALYDMERDRTETTDLADRHPSVVRKLAVAYEQWAAQSNVLPVDALKIEEIPGAENPLTRDADEMNRFLKTVNQELRRRGLPLFDMAK